MKRRNKKIPAIILLLSCTQVNAQDINWSIINLANADAKILSVKPPRPEPYKPVIIQPFDTKEGKISVYLPPLSSTVMLSGTVYLEPTGKDSSKNLMALQAYHLSLGDQTIPLHRGSFQFILPVDPENEMTSLQLKSNTGQIIKSEKLPVTKATINPGGFVIPAYIVSGDQACIAGNFDGNSSNTSVKINGENAELLAESPSRLYFTTHTAYHGTATIECTENGHTQTTKTNVLSMGLMADRTSLRSGQQTLLHIKINGMEGLKEKIPVTIQNNSTSVISLEGGNTQQLIIDPQKETAAGMLEITRTIQSLKNGNFSVSVHIIPSSSAIQ